MAAGCAARAVSALRVLRCASVLKPWTRAGGIACPLVDELRCGADLASRAQAYLGTKSWTRAWLYLAWLTLANPSRAPPQAPREDSDNDMSSTDEEDDAPPALHSRALAHAGGVNRLRAMPQAPGVLAAWADSGAVQARAGDAGPCWAANRMGRHGQKGGREDSISRTCRDCL